MRPQRFLGRQAVASFFVIIFSILMCLMGGGTVAAQSGSISIAKVYGQCTPGQLRGTLSQFRFVLRYTNNTEQKCDVFNSWKISSPDGAQWLSAELDSLGPFPEGHSWFLGYFSNYSGIFSGNGSSDGQPDTLGFSGTGSPTNPALQLPVGFDDTILAIRIETTWDWSVNDGRHICLDTVSRAPFDPWPASSNIWHWASQADPENPIMYSPAFDGGPGVYSGPGVGYCFQFFTPPNCAPTIAFPPLSLSAAYCANMAYHFTCSNCFCTGDSAKAVKISGPGEIDQNGNWTWNDIPASAVGDTNLVVRAKVVESGELGGTATVRIHITDANFHMSAGCGVSNSPVGVPTTVSFAATPQCEPVTWQALQTEGTPAGYSVNSNGELSFEADSPGIRQIKVIASAHGKVDSCWHAFITNGGPGCCVGQRGNVNAAGTVDLSDLSMLINYLLTPYAYLGCYDAANINGAGIVDLSDLSMLIAYLTKGNTVLPGCP